MHMISHLWQDMTQHVLHIHSFIGSYVGHNMLYSQRAREAHVTATA